MPRPWGETDGSGALPGRPGPFFAVLNFLKGANPPMLRSVVDTSLADTPREE